jgi:protoporphyrinogen oxidase
MRERMDRVAIIGAGPAGLTAAWELTEHDCPVTVLEAHPRTVGGLARTVRYKDFLLDVGGHRFFSKSPEIEALWTRMLPDDLLLRPRKSRIYFAGRLLAYPLKPLDVFARLGAFEAAACTASYLKARVAPAAKANDYRAWIVDRFGERLYRHFFETYTEKVWGMPCHELSADWAAQRIRTFSLGKAILNALPGAPRRGRETTLVDSFRYPRQGPGMLWEACAATLQARGTPILMGARVERVERLGTGGYRIRHKGCEGEASSLEAAHVVTSAPLADLVRALVPVPSPEVIGAARGLHYRALVLVALFALDPRTFTDTWLYAQDASIHMGRVQNYKAWSPEMVPDPDLIALGCEYFCSEGDACWNTSDRALIVRARSELDRMGLLPQENVFDACVIRQPKAYPVYDRCYASRVERVMSALRRDFPGLYLVGRNGMHRYNNQDHSMMTALLTARNILAGKARFDVRRVGQDAEYLEA